MKEPEVAKLKEENKLLKEELEHLKGRDAFFEKRFNILKKSIDAQMPKEGRFTLAWSVYSSHGEPKDSVGFYLNKIKKTTTSPLMWCMADDLETALGLKKELNRTVVDAGKKDFVLSLPE